MPSLYLTQSCHREDEADFPITVSGNGDAMQPEANALARSGRQGHAHFINGGYEQTDTMHGGLVARSRT